MVNFEPSYPTILSNSVRSIYVSMSAEFFAAANRLTPGVAYLKQRTARLRVYVILYISQRIVPGVTNMTSHYNLSPAVMIYRRYPRVTSSDV